MMSEVLSVNCNITCTILVLLPCSHIYLLFQIVELKANETEQGKALYLLLKLVQSDTSLFSQFVQEDCHKLLLKVLGSQRCVPGHHMLKVLLFLCTFDYIFLLYTICSKFNLSNTLTLSLFFRQFWMHVVINQCCSTNWVLSASFVWLLIQKQLLLTHFYSQPLLVLGGTGKELLWLVKMEVS